MTLSSPSHELYQKWDVIIIGSGYGGSIAAYRFAKHGLKVAVLERGREFLPGTFPRGPKNIAKEFTNVPMLKTRPDALIDNRSFQDATVVLGQGLGGGSLINAAVVKQPDSRVFEQDCWPSAIQKQFSDGKNPYFEIVRERLGFSAYPSERQSDKQKVIESLLENRRESSKSLTWPLTSRLEKVTRMIARHVMTVVAALLVAI